MRIAGFQKLTLVDFPGKIAASIFTQGCNFRCGYCHNPELALPSLFQEPISPEIVLSYLNGRRGLLEGVVITGGEPTLQKGLADFMRKIKEMGFLVKLDTNGSHPEVIADLLRSKQLDYIAMDIKTSLVRYAEMTGIACDTIRIKESIDLIINSGIPYQLRTTLVKEFCSDEDLGNIQHVIGKARHYVLQPFVLTPEVIDPHQFDQSQYTHTEIETLKAKYERYQTKGI